MLSSYGTSFASDDAHELCGLLAAVHLTVGTAWLPRCPRSAPGEQCGCQTCMACTREVFKHVLRLNTDPVSAEAIAGHHADAVFVLVRCLDPRGEATLDVDFAPMPPLAFARLMRFAAQDGGPRLPAARTAGDAIHLPPVL